MKAIERGRRSGGGRKPAYYMDIYLLYSVAWPLGWIHRAGALAGSSTCIKYFLTCPCPRCLDHGPSGECAYLIATRRGGGADCLRSVEAPTLGQAVQPNSVAKTRGGSANHIAPMGECWSEETTYGPKRVGVRGRTLGFQ